MENEKGLFFPVINKIGHNWLFEDRIFMFIDLNDSTKLVETLGPAMYGDLLLSVFAVPLREVASFSGELYQVVGDEAVFTWSYSEENIFNSVRFYQYFRTLNSQKAADVTESFQVVPQFKACIHTGKIAAMRPGPWSDSLFVGMALNVCGRMLEHARSEGLEFLVSENIYRVISSFKALTTREFMLSLRGVNKRMKVFEVFLT